MGIYYNLIRIIRGGRVSVFENTNKVDFLPGAMHPDREFIRILYLLSEHLGIEELHFTGGEPTLHAELPELIELASSLGFSVKMTSNGENSSVIRECASAGLKKINFSIFGTTPEELASVQHERYRDVTAAEKKIQSLHDSISEALKSGIEVDSNIVMSDYSHYDRIERIINEYDDRVSVRVLNDLSKGDESYFAIYKTLAKLGAHPEQLKIEAGTSNSRVKYRLPNGRPIYFKQIRRTSLPNICDSCEFNNDVDCKEGYYGIRVYSDINEKYKVGVCLQRMDLTMNINDFIKSGVSDDINELRLSEMRALNDHYANRLNSN